jgi:hypothetical protein
VTTRASAATAAWSSRAVATATALGIVLGIAYTLSPLTIWAAVGTALLGRSLVKDLEGTERRVILAIFIIAILARLAILAGLFLSVDHTATPFGSLFGDEEYFKRRSMWLRSMALGVNVSEADRNYALDEYSETSYLYLLAFLQMLVGDAPYGVHVLSMSAYLAAAVWLFRFARRGFGPAPAALAFFGVLFLPTLFFWSVSALRESVHFLLTFAAIAGASEAIAGDRWRNRLVNVGIAAAAAYALKDFRAGSMSMVAASIVAGTIAAMAAKSARRLVFVCLLAIVVGGLALARPAVQERIMGSLRVSALRHQGHAFTGGLHYQVLDPRFYEARSISIVNDITRPEAARYVIRALIAGLVLPWPWQAETRLLQAYLPEHVLWFVMIALLPFGIRAGLSRHPVATLIMASYIGVMFAAIALYSGNVGTLARHRGLLLPFVICLSAVAVCDLLARVAAKSLDGQESWRVDQGSPSRRLPGRRPGESNNG